MENEHCYGKLSTQQFTSGNFDITTTPAKEWAYVLEKEVCPEAHMGGGRRIPSIDRLMELDEADRAKLIRPEVVAVVLYTGPMVRLILL